jgi:hypothetical protein
MGEGTRSLQNRKAAAWVLHAATDRSGQALTRPHRRNVPARVPVQVYSDQLN